MREVAAQKSLNHLPIESTEVQETGQSRLSGEAFEQTSSIAVLAVERTTVLRDAVSANDKAMTPAAITKSIDSMPTLQKALEDDKRVGTGAPLSERTRNEYHSSILKDLEVMSKRASTRQDLAQHQTSTKQYADAEKTLLEAVGEADKLPIALMIKEAKLVEADAYKTQNELTKLSARRSHDLLVGGTLSREGTIDLPVSTRRDLLALYLGVEPHQAFSDHTRQNGAQSLKLGENGALNFNKAFDVAQELRLQSIRISGRDPLVDNRPGDVPKEVFQAIESGAKKRFEIAGLVRPEEFSDRALKLFGQIDSDGNKSLSQQELDAALHNPAIAGKDKQVAYGLRNTSEMLQDMSLDTTARRTWFGPIHFAVTGITPSDLNAFKSLTQTAIANNQPYNSEKVGNVQDTLWKAFLKERPASK